MKNYHNQEILFEKMSEQKIEIENLQDKLFDYYVFKQKFDQQMWYLWQCFENNINLSQHLKNDHDCKENI